MNHASYHNHTHFSDGADAPEAFVAFAKAANITSLGFSDHYYKASPEATATPDWALPCDTLDHYFDSIHDLKIRTEGIEILAGLEFDWLEHSADWLKPIAQDPRLDYTIGSVHFVGNDALTFRLSTGSDLQKTKSTTSYALTGPQYVTWPPVDCLILPDI